jgi:hypothetical protein
MEKGFKMRVPEAIYDELGEIAARTRGESDINA